MLLTMEFQNSLQRVTKIKNQHSIMRLVFSEGYYASFLQNTSGTFVPPEKLNCKASSVLMAHE